MFEAVVAAASAMVAIQQQKLSQRGRELCTDGCNYYYSAPVPAEKRSDACGGCGSREILIHNGQRICPYCRGSRE